MCCVGGVHSFGKGAHSGVKRRADEPFRNCLPEGASALKTKTINMQVMVVGTPVNPNFSQTSWPICFYECAEQELSRTNAARA